MIGLQIVDCVDCGEGRLYSAAQRPEPEVGVGVERGGGRGNGSCHFQREVRTEQQLIT